MGQEEITSQKVVWKEVLGGLQDIFRAVVLPVCP